MNDFDDLKNLWQQSAPPITPVDQQALQNTNATHQQQLERTQWRGAVLLILTAIVIVVIGFGGVLTFHASTTYIAVGLLALLSAGQGFIGLYVYRRLRSIDVAAPVTEHLHQWETYYAFRKRLIRTNLPLYYLLLNGAFALYFVEILGIMPILWRILSLTLYIGWMLFAWFVLGKRSLRREENRLANIMDNLREQQAQLGSD